MRHGILLAGACLLLAGCQGNGDSRSAAEKARDAGPAYAAVLKAELKAVKEGETVCLFVDGKDPEPELLKRFQKQSPELQPGSTAPKGRRNSISLDRLKWIDRNHVELHGGFSNGMDGRGSRYLLENQDGTWVITKAKLEVQS